MASTIPSALPTLKRRARNIMQSMASPGKIYPIGASAPMLPTVPMHSAIPLCTAPISVPAPKRGMNAAAMTRNIIEKLVPIPPGI